MKRIKCEITGISPLLMHAFPMEEIKAFEKLSKDAQAEYAAYRTPDTKELHIPGVAIQRSFISGAAYSKGKGRSTLQKVAAACVVISPECLSLNQDKYEIDSRPVVNPMTKGRHLRHRPRFNEWKVSFEIEFDEELLTEKQIRQIVDDTGTRVGVLDFRPEKKGPFGRFKVTRWNTI